MTPEGLADYIINNDYFCLQVYKPDRAYEMQQEMAEDGIQVSVRTIRAACFIARQDPYMRAYIRPLVKPQTVGNV